MRVSLVPAIVQILGGGFLAAIAVPVQVEAQAGLFGGVDSMGKVLGFAYVASACAFVIGLVGAIVGGSSRLIWLGSLTALLTWAGIAILHSRSDLQWWSLHLLSYAGLTALAWGASATWARRVKESNVV